jgi:acetolactate synthase I/II/III large subunit
MVGADQPGSYTLMESAAAEFVTILNDEGISHVFVNPGRLTGPIRDAFRQAEAQGTPHPQAVVCIHERVAMAAAHGHHLVSGRPQVVVADLDSDDPDLVSAVDAVQRDGVAVTVLTGAGAGATTSACKWVSDFRRMTSLGAMARRALQISRTDPAGVALMPLPSAALEQEAGKPTRRLASPRPPAPPLAALEEMAELLAAAESPVLIAGRVGRHVAAVHHVARLAETLGAPVIDLRTHVNLPPNHSLTAAGDSPGLVARADAVLLLDVQRPCIDLPPQAWLLQIDTDCLKTDLPNWACAVEVAITADTEQALPVLIRLVADRLTGRSRPVQDRRARVETELQSIREGWRERAVSAEAANLPDAVMAELDRTLPEDALVVEEAGASQGAALRQMERQPGHFFRGSWSSPGWSVGAALGLRLARPGQPVVAICDETAFASGLPTAAYWAANRAGAPFLTVVLDRAGRQVAAAARAGGAETEIVSGAGDIAAAVERLLATTRDGVCAVLDARLPRPQTR